MEERVTIEYFVKKLGRDTLIYVPAKILPGFFTILSVAIFTRLFNPDEYGRYIMVITTVVLISTCMAQWLVQSIIRYRAQYLSEGKKILFDKYLLYTLLLLSGFLFSLTALFLPFKKYLGSYENFYLIGILLITSDMWFNILIAVYQADLKSNAFTFFTIFNAFLKLILSVVFVIFIKKDISYLFLASFLASFIALINILGAKLFFEKSSSIELAVLPGDDFLVFLKKFIGYGFPMIGWFLCFQLLGISDRYFLQIFRSSWEVGVYSSNYNLVASAINFLTTPILNAAHPLLMKAGIGTAEKRNEFQKLITLFSRYFLMLSMPLIIYVFIFSEELAIIFLGADYRQGNGVIPILVAGFTMWYLGIFGHKGFEIRENTGRMFLYVIICVIVKVTFSLLFIPRYGYIAAAITTLVAFTLYPILIYFGTFHDIKWIFPWQESLKVLLAGIAAGGILVLVKKFHCTPLFILISGGIILLLLYALFLFLIKGIKRREIEYVRQVLMPYLRTRVS